MTHMKLTSIILTLGIVVPSFGGHLRSLQIGQGVGSNITNVMGSNNSSVMASSNTSVISTSNTSIIGSNSTSSIGSSNTGIIDSPQAAIEAARNELIKLIEDDKLLGYAFVRLGFHDCVGGCDGCVDLLNPDNRGLGGPIAVLENIVQQTAVHGVTRADIWALAAMTYADHGQGKQRAEYSFDWFGRPTCDKLNSICRNAKGDVVDCSPTRGPHRDMPTPDLDTRGVLDYFDKAFGLDARETVALMGGHTIGRVERGNSGFVGDGWDSNPSLVDNAYYTELVGGTAANDSLLALRNITNWRRLAVNNSAIPGMPNRHQWRQGKKVMINADISMIRNFAGKILPSGKVTCTLAAGRNMCPVALDTIRHMAVYRNDNQLWLDDFRDVFTFVLEFPFKTEGGCGEDICFIGDLPS